MTTTQCGHLSKRSSASVLESYSKPGREISSKTRIEWPDTRNFQPTRIDFYSDAACIIASMHLFDYRKVDFNTVVFSQTRSVQVYRVPGSETSTEYSQRRSFCRPRFAGLFQRLGAKKGVLQGGNLEDVVDIPSTFCCWLPFLEISNYGRSKAEYEPRSHDCRADWSGRVACLAFTKQNSSANLDTMAMSILSLDSIYSDEGPSLA